MIVIAISSTNHFPLISVDAFHRPCGAAAVGRSPSDPASDAPTSRTHRAGRGEERGTGGSRHRWQRRGRKNPPGSPLEAEPGVWFGSPEQPNPWLLPMRIPWGWLAGSGHGAPCGALGARRPREPLGRLALHRGSCFLQKCAFPPVVFPVFPPKVQQAMRLTPLGTAGLISSPWQLFMLLSGNYSFA